MQRRNPKQSAADAGSPTLSLPHFHSVSQNANPQNHTTLSRVHGIDVAPVLPYAPLRRAHTRPLSLMDATTSHGHRSAVLAREGALPRPMSSLPCLNIGFVQAPPQSI
eukprot:EG_transcript_53467